MTKTILDACCGSRMFWFDRQNKNTVFMDNRTLETTLCDGRKLTISPDVIGDFRKIPFAADTFSLVVFDPPHLIHAGEKSWLAQKYGRLCPGTWKDDIRSGFSECFRVLKPGAFLIFKWNENQIKIGEVVKLAPFTPLFGQRSGKTHWLVFMKETIMQVQDEEFCIGCKHYKGGDYCDANTCRYEGQTNGDEIRAMDNEQLAKIFAESGGTLPGEDAISTAYEDRFQKWLDYLNQYA